MKLFLYTILICNLIYSCSFNSSKNKFEWNQLLKEFPNKNKMALIFIISTKDSVTIAKTNQWKHLHKFIYPIFYDIKNTFNDMNKFNDDPMFQTFLLDQNNKILLIGNPIYNAEIKTLYQNILNK